MLPIVDKPKIQFIIEEALASGIEDIVIVDGKSKRSIEDHFDSNPELENNLKEKGKDELLKLVEETTVINLYFIRQSHPRTQPRGLGDAVLTAKSFIGDEPFVVMLSDDLIADETPLTKQFIDRYNTTGESTLAVMKVPHDEQVSEYGVIAPEKEVEDGLHPVNSFVEKPKPEDEPSDLVIIGRYLLTPEIFEELENTAPGKGNEIQLTDAIDSLNKRQHVYVHEVLMPRIANLISEGKIKSVEYYMKQSFEFINLLALSLMMGLAAISSKFVPLFFGEKFSVVALLVIGESPVILIISWSIAITNQYLIPSRMNREYII